jgi:hypothetical protein
MESALDAAHSHGIDESILQKVLPPSYTQTVELTKEVRKDTSAGKTCLVNKAEVPVDLTGDIPVRFNADFKLSQSIAISDLKASLIDSEGGEPFFVKVDFKISDLKFNTVRPADVSFECVGLDRNFTINLKSLTGSMYFGAPKKGRLSFRYIRTEFKIGDIKVTNDGDLLKEFISKKIDEALSSSESKKSLETGFASALGGSAGPAVASLFDLIFSSSLGSDRESKLEEVTYLKSGRKAQCAGYPCGLYLMKH